MNKTQYFLFLTTIFYAMICSSSKTAHCGLDNKVIFVATPNGIVPYVLSKETLIKMEEEDNKEEQFHHQQRLYTATTSAATVKDIINHEPQRKKSCARKSMTREQKSRWFTDDYNNRFYGVIVDTDVEEPLFLLEEQVYVARTRTIYIVVQPPTQRQSRLEDIDEYVGNSSFALSRETTSAQLDRSQTSPFSTNTSCDPQAPSLNGSFGSYSLRKSSFAPLRAPNKPN